MLPRSVGAGAKGRSAKLRSASYSRNHGDLTMIKLPAGSYYIGDPCYVIDRAKWGALIDQNPGVVMGVTDKAIDFEGHKLWMHKTRYGDGGYYDQHGAEYSVDSGLLAAVPLVLCERTGWERLGCVVHPSKTFSCSFTKRGVFRVGAVRIQT